MSASMLAPSPVTSPVPSPVTSWPEQWFKDYADSGRYAMQSLMDYLTERATLGVTVSHEISFDPLP